MSYTSILVATLSINLKSQPLDHKELAASLRFILKSIDPINYGSDYKVTHGYSIRNQSHWVQLQLSHRKAMSLTQGDTAPLRIRRYTWDLTQGDLMNTLETFIDFIN